MMKLLVHNSILDTLEEIIPNASTHFLRMFEEADKNNPGVVDFNINNCTYMKISLNECIPYLESCGVDITDMMLCSTLLASGYVQFMRGYQKVVEQEVLG